MGFYLANYIKFNPDLMTYLLQKGADLNIKYNNSSPLVYLLARDKDDTRQCIPLLFKNGLELDPQILQCAYSNNQLDAVKLFITQDIRLEENDCLDLIKIAYNKNNLALAGMLLEKAVYPRVIDQALLWAVRDGRIRWVELLFAKGADISQQVVPETKPGETITSINLAELARQKGHNDIAKFLIQYGVGMSYEQNLAYIKDLYQKDDLETAQTVLNSQQKNRLKDQVLLWAVKDERIPWVTSLFFKGGDVNAVLDNENSLLFTAFKNNDSDMIQVLQSLGAKVRPGEWTELLTLLYQQDQPGYLKTVNLAQTAKPEMNSLLLTAVKDSRAQWVNLLLEKGADLETTDSDGNTPLILALDRGVTNIVRDIMLRSDTHETSFKLFIKKYPKYDLLWGAITANYKEILRYGKKRNLVDLPGPQGMTAMQLYLAYHGGTLLHWYALTDNVAEARKNIKVLRDKIFSVDDRGQKAVDLAVSGAMEDLLRSFMF